MHALRAPLGAVVLLASVLGAVVFTQLPSAAAGCPPGTSPVQDAGGGLICIVVANPGKPGAEGPKGGGGGGGGGTVPAGCFDGGKEVPCYNDNYGPWNAAHSCYAFKADPQPPAGAPEWEGHDPSEGAVYSCVNQLGGTGAAFFQPNGAVQLIDPAVLARRALGQMRLERAEAHSAPDPGFHTYVHIDNWLWLPQGQWHDLTETVTAGPTSVTVTAEPIRVNWNMGTEVTSCYDAGRVWTKGMTDAAKTTCSYAYESIQNPAGDKHSVSAQLVYAVTWDCGGACLTPNGDLGEIDAPAGAATTIEVRQRQTVVTR